MKVPAVSEIPVGRGKGSRVFQILNNILPPEVHTDDLSSLYLSFQSHQPYNQGFN